MPPTKTKPKRDFEAALTAYLAAVQDKRAALLAAVDHPSKSRIKQYEDVALKEKEDRRAYRKATKLLHALIQHA